MASSITEAPATHSVPKTVAWLVVSAVSTNVLAHYLQWQPEILFWVILFALSAFAIWRCPPLVPKSKAAFVTLGLFAVLLDLSLVLGYHIALDAPYPSVNGKIYAGLAWENYITPYSPVDLFSAIAMLPSLLTLSYALFSMANAREKAGSNDARPCERRKAVRINRGFFVGGIIALIVLWMPYLLAYWPGLIFGDTTESLKQILGITNWNNHHPVVYTAFISLCLKVAHALNFGNTAGCALYSLLQMGFLACCFSYVAQWVTSRGRLHFLWNILLLLVFGLTPFIAVYSIAMWKDPVFSAGIMVLSVMLFDYVETEGGIVSDNKLWLPLFVFMMLVVCLLRSNGLIIAVAVAIVLIVGHFRKKGSSRTSFETKAASIGAVAALVVSILFLGPLTSALHIEKVGTSEGTGILYNQMARVVTYQGDMSDENESFLDSLLPIEEYQTTYRPCCFDLLKYAFQDNGAYFGMKTLLANWSSMLVKNPGLFLEAWELQTFGFWAINQPEITSYPNISAGVPRNTAEEEPYASQLETVYEINDACKLPGDPAFWRSVFPLDIWTPPAAILFWIALYLACLCFLSGRRSWVLSLLPTLLLFLSMFIATPIAYWPRYVAAAYFLVPFYALLLYLLLKPHTVSREDRRRPRKRAR